MKQLILFFVGILVITACQKEQMAMDKVPQSVGKFSANEVCDSGDCEYSTIKNAALNVDQQEYGTYVNIVGGDNLVFSFQFDFHDEPMISDDELTEFVYFEIPPNQLAAANTSNFSAFELTAEDANTYFGSICFCADGPFFKITEGSVYGQQVTNDLWTIDVDVVVEGKYYTRRTIQYSANYKVK